MLKTIGILYFLLLCDTSFSGICAASGRNPLIGKKDYYIRSMWDGVLWGNGVGAVGVIILFLCVQLSAEPAQVIDDLTKMGQQMNTICGLYALIVFTTFAVRAIPSVDIRSATSTLAFGPLTVARPLVILLGIGVGLMSVQPDWSVVIAALLIAAMMVPFRRLLNWQFDKLYRYTYHQQL